MSLKLKVMLILLCVFGLYGVMNFWVQRYVIFPGFLSLERDEAIKNAKRIEKAFKNEIHRLDSICWDWSAWNDSYQFMESRSAEYIETNLIPGTFAVNNINTIYFINTKEKIIWCKTYDPKYNKIIQLTDFPKDTFPPNHPLISYLSKNIPVTKMGVAGIYMTQNGPMFISSRPITKSNDEGPFRGSLIFGRFLNDEFVKTLVDQTKINFQAFPVHAGSLPTPLKDIPNRITDESRYLVDSSTNDSIYAYTTLPDIIGNAAILIKSQTPKKISEQGYVTVSYAMYLILAIGIGVLIVMSLLLHYSVLGPITDLKNHVMLIRKTGDISASLSSQRRDEIGILAIEFDRMLEQLQRFQTKLEVKVKERTSELAITNENLQQKIEERKQAEEALRESEEKYRSMMEAMQDLAYIRSPEFRIEYMNPAMIKRTGSDATGESCYKVINGLEEKCPWCIQQDRTQQGEHYLTEIISPKDGLTYSVSYSPIHHVDGTISILSIYRDKNMAQKLQRSQKMESMGLLAGGVAHDFNNALYSIIGYADLTMDDVPEGSLAQSNLKEVLNAAYRSKNMVQQILTFSRQKEPEKKLVKVQSVVKEAIQLLMNSIPTSIEIRQNIDEDCKPMMADPTQIHQVVMNLATNAYHAMREKGGVLTINVTKEKISMDDSASYPDLYPGTYLKLTVSDTGHGMDKSIIPKIFDPFFTTKPPGEGTGMGLSIIHGIVKSHGGDIKVYSEPGKGTVFNVYFPLIEAKPVEPRIVSTEPIQKGSECILLVDDEEPIVRMVKQTLERLGYQVATRTGSVDALEAFRANPDKFDLVITDMSMPNMSGVELAPRLLEIRADIPIILCTGFSEMINENKAKALGIREFVMKPVVKDEIARIIRKVLDE